MEKNEKMSQIITNKTPVSLLQEFATKHGYPRPIYEFLKDISKFGTHLNKFHFKVTIAHVETVGSGSSKMAAKHDAACKALRMMQNLTKTDKIPDLETLRNQKNDDSVANNYISKLNELSMKLKLPAPIYSESGSLEVRFKYECRLDNLTSQGFAVKKKEAKQLSAKNMLEKVSQKYSTQINDFSNQSPKKNTKKPQLSFHEQIYNRMIEKKFNFEDFFVEFQKRDKASLKFILNQLEIRYSVEICQDVPPIAVAHFDLSPPETVRAIGTSKNSAMINLISRIFSLLDVYMGLPPGLMPSDEDNKEEAEFELSEEEEECHK